MTPDVWRAGNYLSGDGARYKPMIPLDEASSEIAAGAPTGVLREPES